MKKVKIILISAAMTLMMVSNVFATSAPPIPWTNDIQDVPFFKMKDSNGQEGWLYYEQGNGIVKNRWVQNYKYDWYYCGEDGFLLKNTWLHDSRDGKYYYLGEDMVMLHDTTTPDGYKVGSDGAWIKDGQVVIENVTSTADNVEVK
ncbi:hypothetical protein SAMN05443270_2997 [Lacrimispora sphenoides]|uniref:hypothetical protein n=1 Tax=Lacrimispora sphenoides TaxID=29370 RepID=UPI0008AC7AA0|nr:hypothetical protein [Lacrimispora sphenoides]SEU08062.1 hypothetical protein SAMN05443270_2997 [Lacrimispora sphenoides]